MSHCVGKAVSGYLGLKVGARSIAQGAVPHHQVAMPGCADRLGMPRISLLHNARHSGHGWETVSAIKPQLTELSVIEHDGLMTLLTHLYW